MTGPANRSDIDWTEVAEALAPVEVIDETVLVRKRSRDFFWYSPILNAQLKKCFGDLVACPGTREEMAHCLAVAHARDLPVVLRGGGTGNYGQAVPLMGGLIIETTGMNRILEIGEGFVRVEAGALMADINAALAPEGWEMAMFPSTQDIATIGGFVAGGSAGIGSIANGALREPGNIIGLKALSVEATPQEHVFEGEDALQVHHAWGLNGAITEVTLRTVPLRDWIGCMATFDSYRACYAAGYALAVSDRIGRKLSSTVDARIVDYFPRLKGHIRSEKHLLVALVPREDMDAFEELIAERGGTVDLALTDEERQEKAIPHVFEFAYNHTTLQVLKADRSATYQQIGVPDASDDGAVAAIAEKLGDDVWPHHEFARLDGKVVAFDLPIIWFRDEARLREIDATYAAAGFSVADAHTYHVEGGGLKNADYRHLAWKKRMDPKGLLNPGKSQAWDEVRDLSPEAIEAKAKG
ncbi:FAD-binding oxidoreductase [Sulfitobacter sp. D35]|uniref:FAD-binding oxidoreductase n=1 Tax=Sulfitobacter sp. D35 TaxID=3083252 RepID=UPI00296EFDB2|nr:FAD-binding oxidoreductase [Sulfitobacter sp. D35]MDW4500043.1 FAD-binding oxidoreductase [Sulfitobacter sp. D35]